MPYAGPDRRIHRVLVTRNTEYHLRRDVCIAVRDRRSGRWLEGHMAVSRRLAGAIRLGEGGPSPRTDGPTVGDAVFFFTGERDLITSRIEAIVRPPREQTQRYTH